MFAGEMNDMITIILKVKLEFGYRETQVSVYPINLRSILFHNETNSPLKK